MTSTKSPPVATLNLPPVSPTHYSRNLIRQAVCEVRFPTIFELSEDHPPVKFWNALKKDKDYSTIEGFQDVEVGPHHRINSVAGYQAVDKKVRWKVAIRPSSLTVETSQYDSFDEFKRRVVAVWKAAQDTLDTEFYTRLGLRYVNTVPYDPKAIQEWVRPELAAFFSHPIGTVTEYMTKIVGPTEFGGGYILQSGIVLNNVTKRTEFCLDFDLFKEDVSVSDAPALLDVLHDWEFRLFEWSLGPKAREFLTTPD